MSDQSSQSGHRHRMPRERTYSVLNRTIGAGLVLGGAAVCTGVVAQSPAQSSTPDVTAKGSTFIGVTTTGNSIGNTFGNTFALNTAGNTAGNTTGILNTTTSVNTTGGTLPTTLIPTTLGLPTTVVGATVLGGL